MKKARFKEILKGFSNQKILVIGDLYLDEYLWGKMTSISLEAPVPVIELLTQEFTPGASANTANGVKALGGKVSLSGVIGNDYHGGVLMNLLKERGIEREGIFIDSSRPTTTKTKILSGGFHSPKQQVLRIDHESINYISPKLENKILSYLKDKISDFDALIISDYSNGVVTKRVLREISELSKKYSKIIIGDSRDNIIDFKGFTLIAPNDVEASTPLKTNIVDKRSLLRVGKTLLGKVKAEAVLITRGEKGMSLFEAEGRVSHIPTAATEVFDVTGAGDTVTAAVTIALSSGASFIEASLLSNYAAGVVVKKVGTATVSKEELEEELESLEKVAFNCAP